MWKRHLDACSIEMRLQAASTICQIEPSKLRILHDRFEKGHSEEYPTKNPELI